MVSQLASKLPISIRNALRSERFSLSKRNVPGAVVAREYGLPCVVGIENATNIFGSGDPVRLDGGKGTLQKISNDPVA